MTTPFNKNELDIQIARYLSNEMNEIEKKAFEGRLHSSQADKASFDAAREAWAFFPGNSIGRSEGSEKAWQTLSGRLQRENLIPAGQLSQRRVKFVSILKAAIIIGLFVIPGLFYILSLLKSDQIDGYNQVVSLDSTATQVQTLSEGSIVYLAGNSKFSFPSVFESKERKVLLDGKAFFDIAHIEKQPFIIETEDATVKVLGTAFELTGGKKKCFNLTVSRGAVMVIPHKWNEPDIMVTAGESVKIIDSKIIKYKSAFQPSWYSHKLQFRDETLVSILLVLNRNFGTNFTIDKPETGMQRMTATFNNDTPETIAKLICLTFDLEMITNHDSVVFCTKRNFGK